LETLLSSLSQLATTLALKFFSIKMMKNSLAGSSYNGTARIRHQCRKSAVLGCHRFLINYGFEKMNNI
jgi:hypothetical protein